MSEATANFMQEFFRYKNPDKPTEKIAKEFSEDFHNTYIPEIVSLKQDETFNVSVLSSKTPLSFMTKETGQIL